MQKSKDIVGAGCSCHELLPYLIAKILPMLIGSSIILHAIQSHNKFSSDDITLISAYKHWFDKTVEKLN